MEEEDRPMGFWYPVAWVPSGASQGSQCYTLSCPFPFRCLLLWLVKGALAEVGKDAMAGMVKACEELESTVQVDVSDT